MHLKKYLSVLLLASAYSFPVTATEIQTLPMQQNLSKQEKQTRLKTFIDSYQEVTIQCDEDEISDGRLKLVSSLKRTPCALSHRFWNDLSQLTWITSLNLSDNQLEILPLQICNLINLTKLRLNNNNLQTLPSQIGNLVNLKVLYLTNNKLQILPPEIGNMVHLAWLFLYMNQLQTLPLQIGNLVNLINLTLSNNNLRTLPPQIGNLTTLEFLYLNNNQLRTLPCEVRNLASIRTIDLIGCSLLLPQRDSPASLGKKELGQQLGNKVIFDDIFPTLMCEDTQTNQAVEVKNQSWSQRYFTAAQKNTTAAFFLLTTLETVLMQMGSLIR